MAGSGLALDYESRSRRRRRGCSLRRFGVGNIQSPGSDGRTSNEAGADECDRLSMFDEALLPRLEHAWCLRLKRRAFTLDRVARTNVS